MDIFGGAQKGSNDKLNNYGIARHVHTAHKIGQCGQCTGRVPPQWDKTIVWENGRLPMGPPTEKVPEFCGLLVAPPPMGCVPLLPVAFAGASAAQIRG